jgi:signal transduction histidine kinase
MTVFFISHGLAILVSIVLGLSVYLTNPRRTTNQTFLVLSCILAIWLTHLGVGFQTQSAVVAKFCAKGSTVLSIFIPLGFNWLRASIKYPQKNLWAIVRHAPRWLGLAVLTAALCTTDFYVRDMLMPARGMSGHQPIPEPVYGPGVFLFAAYFMTSLLVLIGLFARDVRQMQGVPRTELQFILLGGALGLLYGFSTAVIVPLIEQSSQIVQTSPIAVIVLDCVVAYGIATKRILEVALFLRRLVAYSLLTLYLVTIYLLVWLLTATVWRGFTLPGDEVPHILAAVVVAFSMLPAHGFLQRFANRLFISWASTNVALTIQKAGAELQAVTTLGDLLQRFQHIVANAVGTDEIFILMPHEGRFVQKQPQAQAGQSISMEHDAPLVRALTDREMPLVLDTAQRLRTTEQLLAAVEQMRKLKLAVAVGVRGQQTLSAILLLGPRLSGRIYSAVEQDTLQALGNQLAVALENAQLYTQVQDGKIYNDLLLDHLVNGVIAINAVGLVNVFNREAQRVTGLPPAAVLGQPYQQLPTPLAQALHDIRSEGRRVLDREIQLKRDQAELTLRAGGAIVTGHAGAPVGALLVFSDVTDVKRLELQIRRADHLASVGTLSAGMAHEIKNPLVALKTFAQLMPTRFDDADFRDTFSKVAQHEIERIDGIVNQLLEFSRPAKPQLAETSLHAILQPPLKLVSEGAHKKGVQLVTQFTAENDRILADMHQLQQVVLNFLLNALDAMAGAGTISLTTSRVEGRFTPAASAEGAPQPYLRLDIADTGCGIPPDQLSQIFDPFFTTKSGGTGLGLSVSYGIIREHGGMVEVESQVGQGTRFHIFFPLREKNDMCPRAP